MKSKWSRLKNRAGHLRKQGLSIRQIEHRLGIPRSTLSYWFKDIILSAKQKKKLIQNWRNGLKKARQKAVLWHNAQKQKRLGQAKNEATKVLEKIDVKDRSVLELALAILYLGEGTKKRIDTAIGSSDPLILKSFIVLIRTLYGIDPKYIRCQLNLRSDQNPEKMKRFWAKELKLPLDSFGYISRDKRTLGSKTYSYYKGVCQVRCGNVAIQRKLLYLSEVFCKKIIENYMGS